MTATPDDAQAERIRYAARMLVHEIRRARDQGMSVEIDSAPDGHMIVQHLRHQVMPGSITDHIRIYRKL